MPLANIQVMPETDQSRQEFDFSHYQDHVQIVQKINAVHGTALTVYPIWPRPQDDGAWKRMHQAFHDEMSSVLGTQGSDLTGEPDQDWHWNNYQEHSAARTKLGI